MRVHSSCQNFKNCWENGFSPGEGPFLYSFYDFKSVLTDFLIHFKTRLKTLHSFMPFKTRYVNPIVTVKKFTLFPQKHKREREILSKPKNREIIHIIVYSLRMKYTFFIFCNITIWTITFHRVPREVSTLNILTIWLQLGRPCLHIRWELS